MVEVLKRQIMTFIHIREEEVQNVSISMWLWNKFFGKYQQVSNEDFAEMHSLQAEVIFRKIAFETAINLIANSISKCEFETYFKGERIKGEEYYLWNIEPNKNQSSSQFIKKWISKLYKENECLIIEQNGQLLVADDFTCKEYALFDWEFNRVTVENFTFNKTFFMSDVLYFRLNDENVKSLINVMYESYGKLISYAQKNYQKSRGNKGILEVDAVAEGKANFKEIFDKLMNERFEKFFKSESAVLPLFSGYKYTDLASKTYSEGNTRDIKAMIDDIYDFTGRAIQIPPVLLKGDVANNENVVDNYLTFCVDPLCDLLQEEINRKRSGYQGYKNGTYLEINTKSIKHIDLLSVSTSIDKLIGSGGFCINDIRKLVNEPIIDEPWAWQHYITKNYDTIENLLKALEGGEKINAK